MPAPAFVQVPTGWQSQRLAKADFFWMLSAVLGPARAEPAFVGSSITSVAAASPINKHLAYFTLCGYSLPSQEQSP